MSQIEFKDVNKVYPNGHVGLKDINLNIEKGDFSYRRPVRCREINAIKIS